MEQQDTGTQTVTSPGDKNAKTLSDWIGDMVALESQIEEALDRQLKVVKDDRIAREAVLEFHDLVKAQREAIKALHDRYGGTPASPVKQVGAAILGKAAGVLDMIRTEGVSKSLRDDYAAFNLAAISYTMLNTTAIALDDHQVATLADQHLRGYAGAVQRINHIISDVVVAELAKDGHQIEDGAAAKAYMATDAAWKATDQAGGKKQKLAG
jgi:ferritin-like metal-binding protein YciE